MRTDYKILIVLLLLAVLTRFLVPQINAMPVETPEVETKDTFSTEKSPSVDYGVIFEKILIWTCETIKQELSQPAEEPIEEKPATIGQILFEVYRNAKTK